MNDPTIGMHKVAYKHTYDSYFSHFEGTPEELINLVKQTFPLKKALHPEGAFSVPIPVNHDGEGRFFSGITKLSRSMILGTQYCKGEPNFVRSVALGAKPLGESAEVIVYSKELLEKNNERCTKCDFEIVSINVSPTNEPSPLHPYKMAKEMLEDEAAYTAEELAKAVVYWSEHVPIIDTQAVEKYTPINPVVVKYLEENKRNEAIKAHQELTGMSEIDAKMYVRNVQDYIYGPKKKAKANWQAPDWYPVPD